MRRTGMPQQLALFLILTLAVVVPLAIWFSTSNKPISWLANRLYVELEQCADEEVDVQTSQLAALGAEGWRVLVQGLQHPRPAIREASNRALRKLLESWKELSPASSASHVSVLADMLARDVPSADPKSLHVSADLAELLLGWPDGGDGLGLVYNCEQVLRAARQAGWPASNHLEAAPEPPRVSTATPTASLPDPSQKAPLNQPAPPTPLPLAVPDPFEFTAATPKEDPVAFGEIESAPIFAFIPSSSGRIDRAAVEDSPEVSIVSESVSIAPPDWSRLQVHEMLRFLRDSVLSAEAEAELRKRNFDALNLRVARIAADSDPETRIKLIHVLPQLAGVNSASWLLVLARDESPQVRASAVGMLSTASDPRIRQQLQKLEETEEDPGVRAAIAKFKAMK